MKIIERAGARIPAIGLGTFRLEGETCRTMVREAIEKGASDDASLSKAMSLMARHGAIADTVGRAKHFGGIARDALAFLPVTSVRM